VDSSEMSRPWRNVASTARPSAHARDERPSLDQGVRCVYASNERKARDGAEILADILGLGGYSVVDDLGENDRSVTGYLPTQEFEMTVSSPTRKHPRLGAGARCRGADRLRRRRADPAGSLRKWRPGHRRSRGRGTLLYCHLAGLPTIDATTCRQRTAETGTPSIGRSENFCTRAGNRSTWRPEFRPRSTLQYLADFRR
jgi:broad specificity phosphatase PhoE